MFRVASTLWSRFLRPVTLQPDLVRQRDATATESRYLRFVYAILALVLVVAAAAKVLFPVPTGAWAFQNKYFFIALVLGEVAAAGWLLFLPSVLPRTTRWFATVLFGALGVYSLRAWLVGESCQCFGSSGISAGWLALFDISAVTAVWASGQSSDCWRSLYSVNQVFRKAALAAIPLIILGAGASYPGSSGPSGSSAWQKFANLWSSRGSEQQWVLLEPETWVGKTCPIIPDVEAAADFRRGQWLIVLYSPDCSHCQQLVPRLVGGFSDGQEKHARLALISIKQGASPTKTKSAGDAEVASVV